MYLGWTLSLSPSWRKGCHSREGLGLSLHNFLFLLSHHVLATSSQRASSSSALKRHPSPERSGVATLLLWLRHVSSAGCTCALLVNLGVFSFLCYLATPLHPLLLLNKHSRVTFQAFGQQIIILIKHTNLLVFGIYWEGRKTRNAIKQQGGLLSTKEL